MHISTFFKFARPAYLFNCKTGFCTVCGHHSLFVLNDTLAMIRNHAICVRCGSVSRHRHVAKCIVDYFSRRGIRRLGDFEAHPELRVFNSVSFGPIVKAMGSHPGIVCSEYLDGVKSGDRKNGILCEDFENLSFGDASFDLVISEDVFEHLKDFRRGFAEVYRVLKKGGAHIFCVPFHFGTLTQPLYEFRNGSAIPLGPIEYHGDSVRGRIPTYTRFGCDLVEILSGMGYEATLSLASYEDEVNYGTFNCCTITAKKP